jgi:hypothetical protein
MLADIMGYILNRIGSSSASGAFEFAAFGSDVRGGVGALLAWEQTEVAVGFSVAGASQQEDALAGGGQLGELVEGEAGALGLGNSSAGLGSELKGGDAESLGDVEESGVIGDVADDGDDPGELFIAGVGGVAVVGEVLADAGEGDGVAVASRLVETLVDDLVELGIGSSAQEGVELHF